MRVTTETRDLLNEVGEDSGQSVDAVIRRGLRLIELEARRRRGEADAWRLANDPDDRAEVAAAMRDLGGDE